MELYYKGTDTKVEPDDLVTDFRGQQAIVAKSLGEPPHKPSSTGRIHVQLPLDKATQTFFPSVYGAEWR